MTEVTEGVVTGGWPNVIAAYTITAAGLLVYAWSLVSRLRRFDEKE